MKNRMTNEEVVRITSEKLCSNDDWRDAYERYAKAITSKKIQFDEAAKFLKKTFPYRKLGLLRIYFRAKCWYFMCEEKQTW